MEKDFGKNLEKGKDLLKAAASQMDEKTVDSVAGTVSDFVGGKVGLNDKQKGQLESAIKKTVTDSKKK